MTGPEERAKLFTTMLENVAAGHRHASTLLPEVYDELRALAAAFLQLRKPGQTLQPTSLVHEAYLKLVRNPDRLWSGRRHFFEVAAKAMRQVLADHAKAAGRHKRGAGWDRVETDVPSSDRPEVDFGALDEAISRLATLNERHARVVELRFYAGLSVEETALILDVSPRTVEQDWRVARAFLRRELREESGDAHT